MRAGVRHGLWLAVAATALCGCETDQQGDVATYRGLSDPPGEAPQYVPGAPLSLELALRLTATHNEQLAIQGERLIQALADQQRLAAALRPTLEFFANFGIEENTGDGVLSSDVGLRGQYRLLTGQSDLRNVRAAEARAEASRWLVLDLREALLVQTARVYYEALRAERSGEVLERSLQTQLERLADARARNEAGFTRPLDVAQIEAQVSRTRAQLIQANQSEGVARAGLALVTNASVAAASLTDGFEPSDDDQDYHGLSRRYRQDVLAAWADADAARLVVDAAIGQHAPSIAINLDYFLARTPDDSLPALASLVAVRVPIFSAGAIASRVGVAAASSSTRGQARPGFTGARSSAAIRNSTECIGRSPMRTLAEVCIRRPVFAVMLIMAMVVVGIDRLHKARRRSPALGGSSHDQRPHHAARRIARRGRIAGLAGDRRGGQHGRGHRGAASISGQGSSLVLATFSLDRDIDAAAQDVRDRVATVARRFPTTPSRPSSPSSTTTPRRC
jgi:hypothetical protein